MQLSSVFASHGVIPTKFTCKGANVNPPLRIKNVPAEAKSLALIVHDPDAPSGDWVHWTVWNLDPKTTTIGDIVPPEASQGVTSFKTIGYGGPCPHSGTHHYVFDLYALDAVLELNAGSTRQQLVQAMNDHVLETAQLVGLCSAA